MLAPCGPKPHGLNDFPWRSQTLPVVAGDKDRSLQEALSRLTRLARAAGGPTPTRIVTAAHRLPAIAASLRAVSRGDGRRGCRRRWRRAGIEQLYTHQAEAFAHVLGGRNVVIDHADGVGQDALLQRAGAATRSCRTRRRARSICFRPRRWRRISSPSCTRWRSSSTRDTRRRDRRVHLRRRHAAGRAARDSRQGARRAQQPRHGALGHPAAPSALGEAVREPAFVVIDELHAYRGVFGSHLAEHPAAAAARLPALRLGSDLHLLVGDDRQSARAGRRADRRAVRAGREERRAARREVLPVRQSAGRQRAARHPALVSRRNAPRRARVPASATCS